MGLQWLVTMGGLEVAFISDSGPSDFSGSEVNAWGQGQLAETAEGPGSLL